MRKAFRESGRWLRELPQWNRLYTAKVVIQLEYCLVWDDICNIFAVERKTTKEGVFMRFLRKKTVIMAAVLLLVIGVGAAFAEDGISITWRNNTVYVTNNNRQPYSVRVEITYSANGYSNKTPRTVEVRAGQTEPIQIGTSAIIESAKVLSATISVF
jgi:hypothetical protein